MESGGIRGNMTVKQVLFIGDICLDQLLAIVNTDLKRLCTPDSLRGALVGAIAINVLHFLRLLGVIKCC